MRAMVVAAVLSATSAARAKDPTPDELDRARTFFSAGAQAYSAANYADAVRSFDQAYELAPRPQLLFSLAQAERKEFFASTDATYLRRAIQHYKTYLEQVPSGGRRSEATEAKADLERALARLDPSQAGGSTQLEKRKARVTIVAATPGSHASIDGGPVQELPYFGDLPPGKHVVRVSAEGYFDREREVSGDKPVDQPVDLVLQEKPCIVTVVLDQTADVFVDGRIVATAPVPRPIEVPPGPHVLSVAVNGKKPLSQEVVLPRGKPFRFEPKLETSGQRIVALSLMGVGAAGIVTGAVFGVFALGQEAKVQNIADDRAAGNIDADRLDGHNKAIERRDSFRNVSIVTLSAGAAVALGGVLLYFFDRPTVNVLPPRSVEPTPAPKPNQPTDITASPALGPGMWGGVLTAKF